MVLLVKYLFDGYSYVINDISDKRVENWLFMGGPWTMLLIVIFYLYFIQNLGPRLMTGRSPLKLDRIIQIYDVVQIGLCAYIFYRGLTLAWLHDYSLTCQPVDYSNDYRPVAIARTVWIYFIVKIIDLLDTVFFILRKKDNQISFLHVYHHFGMVIASWIGVKYFAGGHVTFLGVFNCFVHMVMYSHYLLSSLKISRPWWKKYITQLQIFQFFAILVHFSQLLLWDYCGFPRWTTILFIPQNLFMIVLFLDFYYKTYVKKSPKSVKNGVSTENLNGKPKNQ